MNRAQERLGNALRHILRSFDDMDLSGQQIVGLFLLAIPIACVARTVVFEEVFREAREYCVRCSKGCRTLVARKFFYLFTCEYCFSHYVTILFLIFTRYKLLYPDWRGYVIAFFSLVFVANIYMNLYNRLRVEIAVEKKEAEAKTKQIEKLEAEICAHQDKRTNSDENTEARERGRDGDGAAREGADVRRENVKT